MQRHANNATTTLSAAITTTSATTLTVASAASFPSQASFQIRIDNELMNVSAVGGTTWTVQRGVEGTTPATHANGANVYGVLTARGLYNSTWNDIRAYGAVGDGVTDDTAAFNSAIADAASGGTIFVPAGTWVISSTLTLLHKQVLRGAGWSSVIKLKNTSNTDMIKNFTSVTAGVADAQQVQIIDLALDGNKANQTSGRGIYLSSGTYDVEESTDPRHYIRNVMVKNCKGNGIESVGTETMMDHIHVDNNDGYGFRIGDDHWLQGCSASYSGNDGYRFAGSSVQVTNCKAFYNGRNASAPNGSADGFHIETTSAQSIVLSSCVAQDNARHGFSMVSTRNITIVGCSADSNGANNTLGVGFNVYATTDSNIQGVAFDKDNVTAGKATYRQKYAVQILSASTQNNILLGHDNNQNGAVAGDSQDGNNIQIDGQEGSQTVAYALSITPDPYKGSTIRIALTGNTTIENTVNMHTGCRMTFIFTQDATGGRTVSWGDQYKLNWTPTTTGGYRNSITFECDGGNWIQIASAPGIVSTSPPAGATYYISPTGNDTTGTGTIGNPWFTLKPFIMLKPAPGTTCLVRGGTYTNPASVYAGWVSDANRPALQGTSSAPITIKAYPGETPLFTGGSGAFLYITGASRYVIIDGIQFANRTIDFDGMLMIGGLSPNVDTPGYNTHHITIRNCKFTFKTGLTDHEHAIYVNHGSENNTIEDTLFIGPGAGNGGGWGVHMYSSSNTLPRLLTIQRCIFDGWVMGGLIYAAPTASGAITHCSFLRNTGADANLADHVALIVKDNAFDSASGSSSITDANPGQTTSSNNYFSQTFDANYFLNVGQTGRNGASDGTDAGALDT